MGILFGKTPDARSKLWTLLFIFLVSLPLFLITLVLVLETADIKLLLALIGLPIFIILWSMQVARGTYYEPLQSRFWVFFYRFSAWALIYLFAVATDKIFWAELQNWQISNTWITWIIDLIIAYLALRMGETFKYFSQPFRFNNKTGVSPMKQLLTPHIILEQTVLGLLGYMFIVFGIYLSSEFFKSL